MRKFSVIFVLLAIALVVSVSEAVVVESVVLTSISGGSADYDHLTGVTSWSQGAQGWLMTDSFNAVSFDTVTITGSFSGMTDNSSGGLASAIFNTGTWSMSLVKGILQVDLSGHTVGNYVETEQAGGHIDGRAVVVVDTATFTIGDYFGTGAVQLDWEGGTGSLAGLIADITLPTGGGDLFGDYDTDSYASTNATVTLWADQTVVPEPATLCLLGFGGLVLFRKRKA